MKQGLNKEIPLTCVHLCRGEETIILLSLLLMKKINHIAKILPIIPLVVRKNGGSFKIMLLNFVPGNRDKSTEKYFNTSSPAQS